MFEYGNGGMIGSLDIGYGRSMRHRALDKQALVPFYKKEKSFQNLTGSERTLANTSHLFRD